MVDFRRNKPIQNVAVKVFKIEKEPITLEQWTENLKSGSPFKRLVLSAVTDNDGTVTSELPDGFYEAEVERYGFNKVCELNQNVNISFTEPKKRWLH